MASERSTPSLEFHFEDDHETHLFSPPPIELTTLNYDLSCTNPKRNQQFLVETTPTPRADSQGLATMSDSFLQHQANIHANDFLHQFQSKFIVTLQDSSEKSFGTARSQASEQEIEQLQNQRPRIPAQQQCTPQQIGALLTRKQPANEPNNEPRVLKRNSQNQCFQKKKGQHPLYFFRKKAEPKNKLPELQHAQSEKITKKGLIIPNELDMPLLNHPQTCKHIEANFGFTSKSTPKDSSIARRVLNRSFKDKCIKNSLIREPRGRQPQSQIMVEGHCKPVALEGKNWLKKSNIFLRLPQIR